MSTLDLAPLRQRPVALVVRAWSTHGGTERYCHGFAQWLVQQGIEPHVWCHRADLPDDGVVLHALEPRGRGRMGRMLASLRAVRSVPVDALRVGFLRAPGFDVLRAGGGSHAAWMRRMRASGIADWMERALDRRALGSARCVVVNSSLAKRDVLADASTTADRVIVVRNGVDLTRFSPVSVEDREQAVIFVGHGFSRKGLATAIEAMVHVPGLDLWVVGEDRRAERYRNLAHRLGLSSRVQFLGAVDDIPAVMRRARALVLPTRYDPSANVVLEAMACAVPPVTTRFDGASEVVPMPWLLVEDPTDAIAVSKAIRQAVAAPELGARCRAVATAWSQEASFEQLAAVLLRAAAMHAERP